MAESVEHRIKRRQWEVSLLLLMPDHLHMIARFNHDPGMQRIVSAWKRYTARHLGIGWQRGFFDHRLRNEYERARKEPYVRMNPVHAGLVGYTGRWGRR